MMINKSNICSCGKYRAYKACCGKIHIDITEAVTAEDLMRSRYSAFTMGMGIYLNASHCISTRNELEINNIEKWAKSVKWIRLEILNSTLGTLNDLEGTVEFKAYFKEGLINKVIHENSRFIKTDNVWFYHSVL